MARMIARIHGILDDIAGSTILLRVDGGLTYEIFVSAYTAGRLGGSLGRAVTLHTLYSLQSDNQGSTFVPRLAGFLTPEDKAFCQLLTSVKGIGQRKALRAMAVSTAQIAAAVADRDADLLRSLPEIGRRTADTILAELSGKVDAFLHAAATPSPLAPATPGPSGSADNVSPAPTSIEAPGPSGPDSDTPAPPARALSRQALDVLTQLGENRLQALQWIEAALAGPDRPADVQALLQRVYQIKNAGA